ncbi:MAG: protein kinase, partial [Planctomycetes bacterium]|nr:protein kinase [Planctomycetota bacterium]
MPTRSIFGLDSDQLEALWSMGGPEINETHPQETGKGAERPESAQTTSSVGAPIEQPGTSIGPYKLLQKIGEGGFGVVYLAEQREPMIRRVALKIIKLGMDTNNVVARFEAERQALAMMDHPHIAKVLDAGATETGRPYFVM